MNLLRQTIASPLWWISVIAAGFIVSLGSAYAKSVIDRFMTKFSEARRVRRREAEEKLSRKNAEHLRRLVGSNWFRSYELVRIVQLQDRGSDATTGGLIALLLGISVVQTASGAVATIADILLFLAGVILIRTGGRVRVEAHEAAAQLRRAYLHLESQQTSGAEIVDTADPSPGARP